MLYHNSFISHSYYLLCLLYGHKHGFVSLNVLCPFGPQCSCTLLTLLRWSASLQTFGYLQFKKNLMKTQQSLNCKRHMRMLCQLFAAESVSKDRTYTLESVSKNWCWPNHFSCLKINFSQISFHCADNCCWCAEQFFFGKGHSIYNSMKSGHRSLEETSTIPSNLAWAALCWHFRSNTLIRPTGFTN